MKVLDFYANWCTPCKVLAPVLEKVTGERDINLVKVDIEEDTDDISVKYGVRNIPTVIALDGDNVVGRFSGTKTESELNAFFNSLNS